MLLLWLCGLLALLLLLLPRLFGILEGKRFAYPREWVLPDAPEDRRLSHKGTRPREPLPAASPSLGGGTDVPQITWFGHSTLLIEMGGRTLLIDPVFSNRCSPLPLVGPRRFFTPPLKASDLPHLDAVLITHDHYDHLDKATILALEGKTDRFLVPLGVEKDLERWLKGRAPITALDWWEETELSPLSIACTPARHFSGRGLTDHMRSLPCSYVIQGGGFSLLETGDTAYGRHFEEIARRYGPFDLVLTDGAQYNLLWPSSHLFPEQSAQAARDLGARLCMPIHWGAFVLSDHPWDDPPERLVAAGEALGIQVLTPRPCQTLDLSRPEDYQERWWRDFT